MSTGDIGKGPPADDSKKVSPEIYHELCTSYRGIDDFRAKLLGALPLATGAGILFTAKEVSPLLQYAWAIAIFGILITFGLFCYEIYGITKCSALILTGTKIELAEHEFEISAETKSEILSEKLKPAEVNRVLAYIAENVPGQFASRPQRAWKVFNEPFAAGIIYPAVLASWTLMLFLNRNGTSLQLSPYAWIAVPVFVLGCLGTVAHDRRLDGKFKLDLLRWLAQRQ
jgi:hypothetical protein